MKKIFLMLICALICASSLSAQSLKWGDNNKSDKRNYLPEELLGKVAGNFYLIMREKSSLFLQMYSKNSLKIEKELEIVQKINKDEISFSFAQIVGKNIYIFFSNTDKKEKQTKLYVVTYNLQLEETGKLREVALTKSVSKRESGSITALYSSDSSKIALIAQDNVEDNEKQRFTMFLYDSQMQKISTKNYELPHINKLFAVYDFDMDNEGNFYVFGKLYQDKVKEKRKGMVNYTFEVFVFNQNGSTNNKTISLGETSYLKDMNISIDKQNMVRIIGFYGESPSDDVLKGVFTVSFDKDMNISKKSQKSFSADFVKSFTKTRKKNESSLRDFDIKEILKNDDGSLVILAERSYVVTYTTTDRRGFTQTRYIYHDDDIIWIKLTRDFEIGTMKQIAKAQANSDNTLLHSFVSYHNPATGEITVLFNDNPENKTISGNEDRAMKPRTAALFAVNIDNDGKMSKKLLYERPSGDVFVCPKFSIQIAKNEVILFALRARQYAFGVVTF